MGFCSMIFLLPIWWLSLGWPAVSSAPVAAVSAAANDCGLIHLSNPFLNVFNYCPGNTVNVAVATPINPAYNLPEGDSLYLYWSPNPSFDPFTDPEAEFLGGVEITYPCTATNCPSMLGILVNGCNENNMPLYGFSTFETHNEFMLIHSGCGFNLDALTIDLYPPGPDSNFNDFKTPSLSLIDTLLMHSPGCDAESIFAAGPGDEIPGSAILIVFMDEHDPTAQYDLSDLCATGLPIYVTQRASHASLPGVFANGSASDNDTRTHGIIVNGCGSSSITYALNALGSYPGQNGHVFINSNAQPTFNESNCGDVNFNITIPNMSTGPLPIIIPFTIPADFCTGQSGPVVMHIGTALITEGACEEQVFAPNSPQTVAITILCSSISGPDEVCVSSSPVTYTAGTGSWSSNPPGLIDNSGVFTPPANPGQVILTFTPAPGCPSTFVVDVVDEPVVTIPTDVTICQSETPYFWEGSNYSITGTYFATLDGHGGECDTNLVLNLTVNSGGLTTQTETECESYTWTAGTGLTYMTSGVYEHITSNPGGCMDTLQLMLTIHHGDLTTFIAAACDSYTWTTGDGNTYTSSGVYDYITVNGVGCQDTQRLVLTINQGTFAADMQIACNSYTWTAGDGNTYTTSGTYNYYSVNANGCEDTLQLVLTITNGVLTTENASACESYTWTSGDGNTYTTSGVYNHYIVDPDGCEDTLQLNLTINHGALTNVSEVACDHYTWTAGNGNTYTVSGVYDHYFMNANGCEDTLRLNLTIHHGTLTNVSESACDSYTWTAGNGNTYTASGIYDHYTVNANGCTDTLRLNLTIHHGALTNVSESACETFTWTSGDGNTYITSGVYDHYTVNANGCSDTLRLNLTIGHATYEEQVQSACDTYTWTSGDGNTYTTSGTYDYITMDATGCMDTLRLILTLGTGSITEQTHLACESFTWAMGNGQTYTESGIYDHIVDDGTGCLDTLRLDLTIGEPTVTVIPESVCNEFTWTSGDGETYTESGTYDHIVVDATGCEDTLRLVLAILHGAYHEDVQVSCGPYTWTNGDGNTYTNSGTYDHITTGGNGCMDTLRLVLTIAPGELTEEFVVACDSYEWTEGDGNTYTESGTYDHITLNANGCEDTLRLHLTIDAGIVAMITTPPDLCTFAPVYTLIASPAGGTWSGAVTNNQFDPALLGPGVHEVIYTISSGTCASADTVNVTVYEMMLSCAVLNHETAPGAGDGSAEVTVSGGMLPYVLSWTGPVSGSINIVTHGTQMLNDLDAGVYTVTLTDASGCITTCTFVIEGVPCAVTLDVVTVVDASCGSNNGSISVSATGGSAPYMYAIDNSPPVLSPEFPGLFAGNYTIVVTDNVGCTASVTAIVGETEAPVIEDIVTENSTCNQPDGSITILASGGFGMLSYILNSNPPQSAPLFENLTAGNYAIQVIDEAGCVVNANVVIVDAEGPQITAINVTQASCGGNDGAIFIEASGADPLAYSNGGPFQNEPEFLNIAPGTYLISVRDANGCMVNTQVNVGTLNGPEIEGVELLHTSCGEDNGEITIYAEGGTGTLYYYVNNVLLSGNTITGLSAGTYNITVEDDNGCVATLQVMIQPSGQPNFNTLIIPPSCGLANGRIELTPTMGVAPYQYAIGPVFNYGGSAVFVNLSAGTYIVRMRDAAGCVQEQDIILMDEAGPEILQVDVVNTSCGMANGEIFITATGISLEYSIQTPNYQADPHFVSLAAGTYTITVRDQNGCVDTEIVIVEASSGPAINGINMTAPDCGMSNGEITVTSVTGGVAPYQFALNTPPFGPAMNFPGLPSGTYTVIVEDAMGCTRSVEVELQEIGAQFGSWSDDICEGSSYVFHGNVYTDAGSYQVLLPGGASTGCDSIIALTLTVSPIDTLTLSERICEGEVFTHDGVDYDQAGTYFLGIAPGQGDDCDTFLRLVLTVDIMPVRLTDTTVCTGTPVIINGVSYTIPGDYILDTLEAITGCDTLWLLRLQHAIDFLDEIIHVVLCEGQSYVHDGIPYSQAGLYILDTLPGAGTCDTLLQLDLMVNPRPRAMAGEDQVICGGMAVVLNGSIMNAGASLWTTSGDGVFADPTDLQTTYTPGPGDLANDQVTITLTTEDPDGMGGPCLEGSDQLVVTIEPFPALVVQVDQPDCMQPLGTATVLSPIDDYIYSIDGGMTYVDNPVFDGLAPGDYTVIASDATGFCEGTAGFSIDEPSLPEAEVVAIIVPCIGSGDHEIQIVSSTGLTFPIDILVNGEWAGSVNGLPYILPDVQAGEQIVELVDADGCTVADTLDFPEKQQITVTIQGVHPIQIGESLTLQTSVTGNPVSYTWSPAIWLSCTDCPAPEATPDTNILYHVIVTDDLGCMDEAGVEISVIFRHLIYAPNVISPDDNGINDRFTLYTNGYIKQIKRLSIFDRWGELVFERMDFQPNDASLGWDGRMRGKLVVQDVLVWYAEVELPNGRTEVVSGDITIVK